MKQFIFNKTTEISDTEKENDLIYLPLYPSRCKIISFHAARTSGPHLVWPRTIQFIKWHLEALIKVINICAFNSSTVIFETVYCFCTQRTNFGVCELCRRKICFQKNHRTLEIRFGDLIRLKALNPIYILLAQILSRADLSLNLRLLYPTVYMTSTV